MGSTARDSGTLVSVTAVWGTVLWLSSYTRHFQAHAERASEQQTGKKKKNQFFYFQFSQSSCDPNNICYLSEFVSFGKPSKFIREKIQIPTKLYSPCIFCNDLSWW